MPNTINIEELVAKAKAFDRLQSIADRRNATGLYCVTYSSESILAKMEKECDEEEAQIAKRNAVKAKQQAEKDAEGAACGLFKVGDEITFVEMGKETNGKVVGFTTSGLLAPALEVWTGTVAQRFTKRPSCVKPIKDKVNGLRVFMDGDQHCAVFGDFTNLQESSAGFGNTAAEAVTALVNDIARTT
ncbi:hypothetical protein EON83_12400 [bacterium]|nr:MAG: hypothetical protein EON83_12400 [bacterium]